MQSDSAEQHSDAAVLPVELWTHVLSYLNGMCLIECSMVSRLFYKLAQDRRLWQSICMTEGYMPKKQLVIEINGSFDISKQEIDWKCVYIEHLKKMQRDAFYDRLVRNACSQDSESRMSRGAVNLLTMARPVKCDKCRTLRNETVINQGISSISISGARLNNVVGQIHFRNDSGISLSFSQSMLWRNQYNKTNEILQHTLSEDCVYFGSLRRELNANPYFGLIPRALAIQHTSDPVEQEYAVW